MSSKITIYFAIEIFNREYLPKLYLGLKLLENNSSYRIVIGNQRSLYLQLSLGVLPPGIVVIKSAQGYIRSYLEKITKQGSLVVLQDEESLVSFTGDSGTSRLAKECVPFITAIMAWNQSEYDKNAQSLKNTSVLNHISGNIRTDKLYLQDSAKIHQARIQQIKEKYPNFILYNSTFAQAYKTYPILTSELQKQEFAAEKYNKRLEMIYQNWSKSMQFVFFEFLRYVRLFSLKYANTDKWLVVRPHPADDHTFIKYVLQDIPNVAVEYDNVIVPWIIASHATIGSTCTTLLETGLLEKPAISFLPEYSDEVDDYFRNHISNQVSLITDSADDLLAETNAIFTTNMQYSNKYLDKINLAKDWCSCDKSTSAEYQKIFSLIAENCPRTVLSSGYLYRIKSAFLERLHLMKIKLQSNTNYKITLTKQLCGTSISDVTNQLLSNLYPKQNIYQIEQLCPQIIVINRD